MSASGIPGTPHKNYGLHLRRLFKIRTAMNSYWDLVEPVWDEINIYDGPDVFLETFQKVPLKIGYLYAVHFCQSEVCNGGFGQFFFNSTGVLAPEAVRG
jgi:hypothetical protein